MRPLKYFEDIDSLLIQTDKRIYRDGDEVNFRVFSFDSETRPRNFDSVTITIYDPNNVQAHIFLNVTSVNGKYVGSFQLSNNPTKGEWRINVVVGTAVSIISINDQR